MFKLGIPEPILIMFKSGILDTMCEQIIHMKIITWNLNCFRIIIISYLKPYNSQQKRLASALYNPTSVEVS